MSGKFFNSGHFANPTHKYSTPLLILMLLAITCVSASYAFQGKTDRVNDDQSSHSIPHQVICCDEDAGRPARGDNSSPNSVGVQAEENQYENQNHKRDVSISQPNKTHPDKLLHQPAAVKSANRLVHLDEPGNPWQFHQYAPKLITPQWVGEKDVHAVVVLAIDDMSGDGQRYRDYLTPILKRLQQIDGRAGVSIMSNRPDPQHPNMQWFLKQGVSLETHSMTHPCPLLQRRNFTQAWHDYHDCVDLLASIPGSFPVAFRFGCMDGQNTPSPRAYVELLNGTSELGNYLKIGSNIGVIFTPEDRELIAANPPDRNVADNLASGEKLFSNTVGGPKQFSKYMRPGFVNYVENYPYPTIVSNSTWDIPFVLPDDYTGSEIHGNQSPKTIQDYKAAIDATVIKQGAISLCFHPYAWMRNDQMVEIINDVHAVYGRNVKFLNLREVIERIEKHMLNGHSLRNTIGEDNGVRVMDLDGDGYMDVVIGNDKVQLTKLWQNQQQIWHKTTFPLKITQGVRFGIIGQKSSAIVLMLTEDKREAWGYHGQQWIRRNDLLNGLDEIMTERNGIDHGVRLRDLDGDGVCELIAAHTTQAGVYQWNGKRWNKLDYRLPEGTSIVTPEGKDAGLRFADIDQDGLEDVIFSNGQRYGVWMMESKDTGWTRKGIAAQRQNSGVGIEHSTETDVLPPIVRSDGTNNGAWIKRQHIYWQNEDTGKLRPDHIEKRRFEDLRGNDNQQPKSPETSLRMLQVHEGLEVELVVSEPLVMDPVDIAWGPDGRMWVCEMTDYPLGTDHKGKPGSRIVSLSDTDGDGRYDSRTVFTNNIGFATTVLPWRDGVLVVAAPKIIFMRDTNGDSISDESKVLYEGFGEGNQQHRVNGLTWGLDGWLYVANGDSGGTIKSNQTGETLKLGGFDLRIKPDTGQMQWATGMTQHGRSRDDLGNWIAGNNSYAWQIVLEDHEIRRNKYLRQPPANHQFMRVVDLYPISKVLSHWEGYVPPTTGVGKVTSACGYTFYRDQLFNGILNESVYFSCPVHNCVHREEVHWNGVLMSTQRAEEERESEFLRSRDSWFRPTAIRTGPDGGMYVVDMYRLVIEHPEWIDKNLLKQMIKDVRLRAGHKQGRIYRIKPRNVSLKKPTRLSALNSRQLAEAVNSTNGWQRDAAHMMLTWKPKDKLNGVPHALREILNKSDIAAARVQALSVLKALGMLNQNDVLQALRDKHWAVRRNALRVGRHLVGKNESMGAMVVKLLTDDEDRVKMQAAYTLGEWNDPRAAQALAEFQLQHWNNTYLQSAALTASGNHLDEVLLQVLNGEWNAQKVTLVEALVGMLGASRNHAQIEQIMIQLSQKNDQYQIWQFQVMHQLHVVIDLKIWQTIMKKNDMLQVRYRAMKDIAGTQLDNEQLSPEDRITYVRFLGDGLADNKKDIDALFNLLKISTPLQIQLEVVDAIARGENHQSANRLFAGWSNFSPLVRKRIISIMMSRTHYTHLLLETMKEKPEISVSLSVARRQQLLNHENEKIRKLAKQTLGQMQNPDRDSIVSRYLTASKAKGDPLKGKAIFTDLCSVCHQFDGIGKAIGPDLAALKDKSNQQLVTGIFDPNRAIQENWMAYLAQTKSGESYLGILKEETSTSLTLVGVDGVEHVLLRADLKSLNSTGRSLMPEGLEEAISENEIVHLVRYLQNNGTVRKKFAGNSPRVIKQHQAEDIILPADSASIYGPSVVFEQKYGNLGFWQHEQDRGVWELDIAEAGQYELWINWALASGNTGGSLKIEIGDNVVVTQVEQTGSWDTYRMKRLGKVDLKAGYLQIQARSNGPVQSTALIDLKALKLVKLK